MPYAFALAIFGEHGKASFVFKDNKIVWHTTTCWYVHIFSHEHAFDILQLDGQVFSKYTCVQKRVRHLACGKLQLWEVGTKRATFGYIMGDNDEQIKVYVDVIGNSILFPRPSWNEALCAYDIDDTPVSGF